MGVQLIERDRQNVSVTPVGAQVIERAKLLLASAEDLMDFVDHSAGTMTGQLRLGVIPTIAPFLLPQVLPEVRSKYPDLQIALREDLSGHLIKRLNDHQLDFAIIALPYDTSGLLVKELFADEFWLAAREGDMAFKAKEVTLPAKLAERLLLLEEGHCLREHSLRACKRSEIASSDQLEATSLLTLVQMVESGLGIALLPEMAVKNGILNNTHLIARQLAAPTPNRMIALVARQTTARIEEFMALSKLIMEMHNQPQRKASKK